MAAKRQRLSDLENERRRQQNLVDERQRLREQEERRLQQLEEEQKRLRDLEADRLRREQEADRLRREQDAERVRRQQEAERIRREQEAELLRRQQEENRRRNILDEIRRRQFEFGNANRGGLDGFGLFDRRGGGTTDLSNRDHPDMTFVLPDSGIGSNGVDLNKLLGRKLLTFSRSTVHLIKLSLRYITFYYN